jgi:hypothetical protein
MPAPAPVRLSKSKFVAGVQCLKRLYFQIYQPELATEEDEGQEARLAQGNEVGLLAQSRFPGGVFVGFDDGLAGALSQTASLMEDSSVPAIFEATFQHQGVLVRVDVLQRRPGNRWRLWDLLPFVKKHLYHPQFHGSFSLKAVLPALVSGFGYADMEVSHGGEAGLAWEQMIRGDLDPEERHRLKAAILAYCRQDTLAMAKVLDQLRILAAGSTAISAGS